MSELSSIRKQITFGAKLIISAVLLFALSRHINFQSVQRAYATMNISWYFGALGSMGAAWMVAALKWRLLLPEKILTFGQSFRLTLVGVAYGTLLPGGQFVGEIGKFAHAQSHNKQLLTKDQIFTSILADKIIGLVALLLIGSVGAFVSYTVPSIIRYILFFAFMGTIFLFIFLGILLLRVQKMHKNAKRASVAFQLVLSKILSYISFVSLRRIALSFLYSIAYQLVAIYALFSIARALAIGIPMQELAWIFCATSILIAIPVNYAGFGVREISFVYFFSLFNIEKGAALTFSLSYASIVILGALLGSVFIFGDFTRGRSSQLT